MTVHSRISDCELVLQHCLQKVKNADRNQALIYGKLCGFYHDAGHLTISGKNLAGFLKLDLVQERVG